MASVLILGGGFGGLAAAHELRTRLGDLAACSTTVVFTTHSPEDLAGCDRIVFMAQGGRVGFVGSLDEAREHFHVDSVVELYGRLANLERLPPRRVQATCSPKRVAPSRAWPGGLPRARCGNGPC